MSVMYSISSIIVVNLLLLLLCFVYGSSGNATLILRPPGPDYHEGFTLEASCTVSNVTPGTNITWRIGKDVIKSPVTSSRSPMTSQTHNVSFVLDWKHHNKTLRCVARRGRAEKVLVERLLNVNYAPRASCNVLKVSGLLAGHSGEVAITVSANPAPSLHWCRGHENIDGDTRYKSLPPVPLSAGWWKVRLQISSISIADLNASFLLTASNELGQQNYTILTNEFEVKEEPVALVIAGSFTACMLYITAVYAIIRL